MCCSAGPKKTVLVRWQLFQQSFRESSGKQRGIRKPLGILRAVHVVGNTAHEHEAVLSIADDGLKDLVEFRVYADALMPCSKL